VHISWPLAEDFVGLLRYVFKCAHENIKLCIKCRHVPISVLLWHSKHSFISVSTREADSKYFQVVKTAVRLFTSHTLMYVMDMKFTNAFYAVNKLNQSVNQSIKSAFVSAMWTSTLFLICWTCQSEIAF